VSRRDAVTDGPAMRFAVRSGDRWICAICLEADGQHVATCPIVELDGQIRDLLAHLGLCVANMRETLEGMSRVIRDDRS